MAFGFCGDPQGVRSELHRPISKQNGSFTDYTLNPTQIFQDPFGYDLQRRTVHRTEMSCCEVVAFYATDAFFVAVEHYLIKCSCRSGLPPRDNGFFAFSREGRPRVAAWN